MKFEPLGVAGSFEISVEPHRDARGIFARVYCAELFAKHDLPTRYVQASTSYNQLAGTLRGMHMQVPPSKESKLIRCTRGRLFDVLLDMRPSSKTYLEHCSVILDAEVRNSVYVPSGVAHGFQTLEDATEVLYQMSDVYQPELAIGFRWSDAAFDIEWPMQVSAISGKDERAEKFDQKTFERQLENACVGANSRGDNDDGTRR